MSSWYQKSYAWIFQRKLEHPELDQQQMRKICSKDYPFLERKGWAYKAFLRAMRDHFGDARKRRETNQKELPLNHD